MPVRGQNENLPSSRKDVFSAAVGAAAMTLAILLLLPMAEQLKPQKRPRTVTLHPVGILPWPKEVSVPPPRPEPEPSHPLDAVYPAEPTATPPKILPGRSAFPSARIPLPARPAVPEMTPARLDFPPERIVLSDSDEAPRRTGGALPLYPSRARYNGIEGEVEVVFTVGRDGLVEDIAILRSRPEGVFEQTVTEALRSWRFVPSDKRPDPMRLRQVFRFHLR